MAVSEARRERTKEVLLAEYSFLQSALSTNWSLVGSRANMYLGFISAAGVALAFVSQAAGFGTRFLSLAVIVLGVVLFVGVVTFVRVLQLTREASQYVQGLNRIRHFFSEYAPDSSEYLILPIHDDVRGVYAALGHPRPPSNLSWSLVTVPGMVAVLNAALAACELGLLGVLAGVPPMVATALPVVVFVLLLIFSLLRYSTFMSRLGDAARPVFPTRPARTG